MADDLQLRATIEAILDDRGFKSLDQALGKNAESMQGVKGAGLELQQGLDELARHFLSFLAIGALTEFYHKSIEESAQLERSYNSLALVVQGLGVPFEEAFNRLRDFATALEAHAAIDDAEIIPVLRKFLGILQDVDGAMAATKLAADLSAAGFGSIEEVSSRLVGVIQGRLLGATNAFGIALKDASGNTKSHEEIMRELIARYGGFAEKVEDTQKSLNHLSVELGNVREELGARLAPGVHAAAQVFDIAIKVIQSFGAVLGTVIGDAVNKVYAAADVFRAVFNFSAWIKDPGAAFAQMTTAIANFKNSTADSAKSLLAEWDAIWSKQAKTVANTVKGESVLINQAALADKKANEERAKSAQEAAAKKLAAAKKTAQEEAKAAVDAAKKAAEEELAFRKKEAEEDRKIRADNSKRLVDLLKQEAAQMRAIEKANADADKHILTLKLANETQFSAKWLALEKKRLQQQLMEEMRDTKLETSQKYKILEAYNLQVKKLEADTAAYKKQMAMQGATDALGALAGAFPKVKAFAIAQTVIETYQSAQKAFSAMAGIPYVGPILGAIAAAAAIAAGIQRVRMIESQNPGFDDPSADATARVGGARWAHDMVREFAIGATRGWAEGMRSATGGGGAGGGTIVNRNSSYAPVTTTNVNITGWVGGSRTEATARLQRDLEYVQRTRLRRGRIGGAGA